MQFTRSGMFRELRYEVQIAEENLLPGEDQEPPEEWRDDLDRVVFSDDSIHPMIACRTFTTGGMVYTEWDAHEPRIFRKANELETQIQMLEICVKCWRRLIK